MHFTQYEREEADLSLEQRHAWLHSSWPHTHTRAHTHTHTNTHSWPNQYSDRRERRRPCDTQRGRKEGSLVWNETNEWVSEWASVCVCSLPHIKDSRYVDGHQLWFQVSAERANKQAFWLAESNMSTVLSLHKMSLICGMDNRVHSNRVFLKTIQDRFRTWFRTWTRFQMSNTTVIFLMFATPCKLGTWYPLWLTQMLTQMLC